MAVLFHLGILVTLGVIYGVTRTRKACVKSRHERSVKTHEALLQKQQLCKNGEATLDEFEKMGLVQDEKEAKKVLENARNKDEFWSWITGGLTWILGWVLPKTRVHTAVYCLLYGITIGTTLIAQGESADTVQKRTREAKLAFDAADGAQIAYGFFARRF